MGVSKVIYGNDVLIDLTGDTVTAGNLKTGYTAHGADGEEIVGTASLSESPYFDGTTTVLPASRTRFEGTTTILSEMVGTTTILR